MDRIARLLPLSVVLVAGAVGAAAAAEPPFHFTLAPIDELVRFEPDIWAVPTFRFLLCNDGTLPDTLVLVKENATNPAWYTMLAARGTCYPDSVALAMAPAEAETVAVTFFVGGSAGTGSADLTVRSRGVPGTDVTYTVTLWAGYTTPAGSPPEPEPAGCVLLPAWPNPVRDRVTLAFSLTRPGAVALRLVDVSGRLVRTLEEGRFPAGTSRVTWDGRDARGRSVADGVYLCRLETAGAVRSRSVVVIRGR